MKDRAEFEEPVLMLSTVAAMHTDGVLHQSAWW